MKLIQSTVLIACFGLVLSACATNPMSSHQAVIGDSVILVKEGNPKAALGALEQNSGASKTDLLYQLEKGQLQAIDNQYRESKESWLIADTMIREWEEAVRRDGVAVLGSIGSYVLNDKTRRYEGHDYEKVLLSANLTLNHIMLSNYDDARVEMKRTIEREALIKSFREAEYDALNDEAQKQDYKVSMKDMKEYPMADLDTPEVNSLRNGYENAFSHYLAAYFFEVMGEGASYSGPGYRKVLELVPNSKLAREGLKKLGQRPSAGQSDVLFVIESGFAPTWKSITVPIPIVRQRNLLIAPLAFPVLISENPGFVPPTLSVGGKSLPVETLVNIDAMSRRILRDQMPSILMRSALRAVLKTALQQQANKASPLLGLIATTAAIATEQADDRSWRTLPDKIAIARATLPVGVQSLRFDLPRGVSYHAPVEIGRRFTIIPIRITGGQIYIGQANVLSDQLLESAMSVDKVHKKSTLRKQR